MKISIIDLGSQYTHVIWRSMRDIGVEAVIQKPTVPAADADFFDAYILSGGPSSVSKLKPSAAHRLLNLAKEGQSKKPILGICLGHQLMAHVFGGEIGKGTSAEYGISEIEIDKEGFLLENMPKKFNAWVSHFDEVKNLPPNFEALAHSSTCKIEAMHHISLPLFGLQFHPEVWHTEKGEKILENFANICKKKAEQDGG
ncbi:MAG: GMP synthase subunit A [Candidatus Micrarchaeota archaeon]